MSRGSWPWSALGIDKTDDVKAVRKAYADKLKAMDVDRDAAAYEVLRNARDVALGIAKAQTAAPAVSDNDWSVSPGREPDDDDYDDDDFDDEDFDPDFADLSLEPPSYGPIEIPPEELTGDGPDRTLTALLFPNGEQSDQAFDDVEEAAARAAMQQVIAPALEGDLTRQQMGDYWVADRLASAWPRSAPLVAEAAEAFEWEQRAGQLGEGAAQAFLNARLKGMRFHHAVLQPDHWGYAAWQELSAPEKKSWWQRRRVRKGETRKLVAHIRDNYPELESLLDWGKVADGEQTLESPWPSFGTIVVGIIILAQVLRFCGSAIDSVDEPTYQVEADAPWTGQDRDALVAELFGPGMTYAKLPPEANELRRVIEARTSLVGGAADADAVTREMTQWVRFMIMTADTEASFDQLVRIKQLKLDFLEFAYDESGPVACIIFMDSARLPFDSSVPSLIREDERLLAAELSADGKLDPASSRPQRSARIPGEIFAAAERVSGVSGEAAAQAAQDQGPERERCLFRKALMAEVLRRPGNVTRDLLLIL